MFEAKGATVRFQVRFSKKAADMITGELAPPRVGGHGGQRRRKVVV